jgi:heme/copper-type cytochrome/quinol oxidase subunit 2
LVLSEDQRSVERNSEPGTDHRFQYMMMMMMMVVVVVVVVAVMMMMMTMELAN